MTVHADGNQSPVDPSKLTRLVIELLSLSPAEMAALIDTLYAGRNGRAQSNVKITPLTPDDQSSLEPEFLRVQEIAAILQVSPSAVYDLINKGELPSIRIGRQVRVRREVLQRWMEAQEPSA